MDKVAEVLSQKIVDWLRVHDKIEPEKEELYKYSALIAIQSTINIIATLLLGFIFGAFFENICFFIAFKILRKYSGGLHSSKFSTCFLISTITNIAVLLAIKILYAYPNYYLVVAFEIISFCIVVIFAPITNANKPISRKEYRIYKLIVCVVSAILIAITIALSLLNTSAFSFAIGLAMLLNSVLIIVHILKNKKLV